MLKGLGVATETDSVVALERSRLTLNNSIRSSPIWPSSSAQGTVTELYRRVPERPRHSDIRNDVRIFALDRIKMLHQTKETFEIPEDFSLEKFTGSSFGVYQGETAYIKVWFHPDIADYIKEKIWHESQQIHLQDDGSIIFEAEVAGTDEIRLWIMSWGSKAEVLEPESLREEIRTECEKMAKRYRSPIVEEENTLYGQNQKRPLPQG